MTGSSLERHFGAIFRSALVQEWAHATAAAFDGDASRAPSNPSAARLEALRTHLSARLAAGLPALDTVAGVEIYGAVLRLLRRLPSFSRVHPCQEPARCICKAFVLPVWLLIHAEQHATGAFLNDDKSRARPGNFTAREGNYAC